MGSLMTRYHCPFQEVFQIGKNKGKTFEEVMAEDPTYVAWVMDLSTENLGSSPSLSRFRQFLDDGGYQAPAEDIMFFGKYKGKTFKEMMTEDPSYCAALLRFIAEEGNNHNSVLLRFKKFFETEGFSLPLAEDIIIQTFVLKTSH